LNSNFWRTNLGPPDALFNIEHEREGKHEEVEFQLKWTVLEK